MGIRENLLSFIMGPDDKINLDAYNIIAVSSLLLNILTLLAVCWLAYQQKSETPKKIQRVKIEIQVDIQHVKSEIDERIQKLEKAVDERFQKLEKAVDERFQKLEKAVDERFQKLEKSVDERLQKLEKCLAKLSMKVAELTGAMNQGTIYRKSALGQQLEGDYEEAASTSEGGD